MEACFLWLDPYVVEVLPKFGDTGGADPGLHVKAVSFFLEQLEIPSRLWAAYFLTTLKGRTDAWQCLKSQAAVSFAEMRELFFGYFQPPSGFHSALVSAASSSCCSRSAMSDLAPGPRWSGSDHGSIDQVTVQSLPAPVHSLPIPASSPTPSPTFSYNSQPWSYSSRPIEQQQEPTVWCIFCGKKGHKVEACWKKSRILQVQGAMTRQELDYEDDPSTSMLQQSVLTFEQPSVMSSLPDELATDSIDLQVQAERGVDDVLEETVDSDWLLGFFMDEFGPDSTAMVMKDEQCTEGTDLARAEGKDVLPSNLFEEHGQQISELKLVFGGADQFDALSFPAAEILQLGDGLQQPAATSTPVLSIRQLLQVTVSGRDRRDIPTAAMRDRWSKTGRSCAKDRLQQWLTDDEPEDNSIRARDKDLLRQWLLHDESKVCEIKQTHWRLVVLHPHPHFEVDGLQRWLTDDEPEGAVATRQLCDAAMDDLTSWMMDDELEEMVKVPALAFVYMAVPRAF